MKYNLSLFLFYLVFINLINKNCIGQVSGLNTYKGELTRTVLYEDFPSDGWNFVLNPRSCEILWSISLASPYQFSRYTLQIEVSLNDHIGQHKSSSDPDYDPICTIDMIAELANACPSPPSTADATVYQFDTYPHQPGVQNYLIFNLNKTNPKAIYSIDFDPKTWTTGPSVVPVNSLVIGGSPDRTFRFKINSATSTFHKVDYSKLRFTFSIIPKDIVWTSDKYKGVYDCSVTGSSSNNKVTFDGGCSTGCKSMLQLQVMKLHNTVANPTSEENITINTHDVDWRKAFNFYTFSNNPSITLTEGTGYYVYRMRSILPGISNSEAEPLNWGTWCESASFTEGSSNSVMSIDPNNIPAKVFYFTQFDNDKNWYYTRTMIEREGNLGMKENLIGEQMTYANGLGMIRQRQTFSNSNNVVMVSNEMQDYVGRTALQTMTAAVPNQQHLGYVDGFTGTYSVEQFDANTTYNNNVAMTNSPLANYYSDLNPDKDVPNANGYPFTRTLFGRNSQNEVIETSLLGDAHKINPPSNTNPPTHTNRTLLGSCSDIELVRVFGDEAPNANTVIKKINIDPNGEKSISYIDKTGKTIATCLSAKESPLLKKLPSSPPNGFVIEDTVNTHILVDNKIIASKSLVFEEGSIPLNISYKIHQKTYEDICAGLCKGCDYKTTFTLVNQDDPDLPLWRGESIITPTQPCSSITNGLVVIPIHHLGSTNTWPTVNTYTIATAGKYLFLKEVEVYNKNTTTNESYLNEHLAQLETDLRNRYEDPNLSNKFWEVWDADPTIPVQLFSGGNPIKINLKELKQKLKDKQMISDPSTGLVGVYELMQVSTNDEKSHERILKFNNPAYPNCSTEIRFNIQACKIPDCSNPDIFIDNLMNTLTTRLTNANVLTQFSAGMDDVFRIYSGLLANGTGVGNSNNIHQSNANKYLRIGVTGFKAIMKNMLTDPDQFIENGADDISMKYSCNDIYNAFHLATELLIEFYSPESIQFRADEGLVFEPDFVNDFLQSAGYKLTAGTNIQGDPNVQNSIGFLTTPYRCFKYAGDASEMATLHAWAATSLNATNIAGLAAIVLFFNNYYNENMPTGCTIPLPFNNANANANTFLATNSFSPNLGYFTPKTPLTLSSCIPYEIPTEMLHAAQQGLRLGYNASIFNHPMLSVPNPLIQKDVENFARKLEAACKKQCSDRFNEISIAVSEEFINQDDNYGVETIEGYKNGPLNPYEYFSNNFPVAHKDVFVSGIIENCQARCSIKVDQVISNAVSPPVTIYKLNDDDMQRYSEATTWNIEAISKKVFPACDPNISNCMNTSCITCNEIAPGGTKTPITNCTNIIGLQNTNLAYNSMNFDFQMFGEPYYSCCRSAFAHVDIVKYPMENADPRVPKEYADVWMMNTDFKKSALETMLKFLNLRVNHKISTEAPGKYNLYPDILNYLSPIQYAGISTDYVPIPSQSSNANANAIAWNGNPGEDVFNINIGPNQTKTYFSIGQPQKCTIDAGPNYLIERTTTDRLPFHVNMPVKIKIKRKSNAPLSTPEYIEYEEILEDYNIGASSAPQLSFESNMSSLKFGHTFTKENEEFEFEFTIHIRHDNHNPDNLTKRYSNNAIEYAANVALQNGLTYNGCFPYSSLGRPMFYSNFTLKQQTQSGLTPLSLILNTTNPTCAWLQSNNKGVVFVPFLKRIAGTTLLTAPFSLLAPDPNTEFPYDYETQYDLSFPTTSMSLPTLTSTSAVPSINYNVQVAPLYYNFTDENGVEHHENLMNLMALKTVWHNLFCLQWHPYKLNTEDIDDDLPISCEAAEAVELFDVLNAKVSKLIEDRKSASRDAYKFNCASIESFKDELLISYKAYYHHYTLYYYDRAGNLVRTVAPEGVRTNTLHRLQHPLHTLVTEYNYNSLNNITSQNTPDGGQTTFWYDKLGRIRFSQNAKQAGSGQYSFTNYDNLGRIVMVGQISTALSNVNTNLNNALWPSSGNLTDVVSTYYSVPYIPETTPAIYCNSTSVQRNLLNRVSYSISDADGNLISMNDKVVTFYSYDVHGNVEWLGSRVADMPTTFIRYEYDLISGSVTKVIANECDIDAIYHKYVYDSDKRLTNVYTSHDNVLWDKDAEYNYYQHGPLRNIVIGQDKLQKVDYAYTINGWLKGMNHLCKENSMTTNVGTPFPIKDLFAMKLHYFNNDFYRSYNGTPSAFNYVDQTTSSSSYYNIAGGMDNIFGGETIGGLYNGNIRGIFTATTNPFQLAQTTSVNDFLYAMAYDYDELNRLKETKFYQATTGILNLAFVSNGNRYSEEFTYDANGNMERLKRHDGNGFMFDNLRYNYCKNPGAELTSNRLNHVTDLVTNSPHAASFDIKHGQSTNTNCSGNTCSSNTGANYKYDCIGNLIKDKQENLNISWNNFGKVSEISKAGLTKINYIYDAFGQRVAKRTFTRAVATLLYPEYAQEEEFYMRDATGNILTTYTRTNTKVATNSWQVSVKVGEQPLYGSDRLGVYKPTSLSKFDALGNLSSFSFPDSELIANQRQLVYRKYGDKRYELKDHLGNVRSVFTDELLCTHLQTPTALPSEHYPFTPTNSFQAKSTALYNYYAFGSPMPNEVVSNNITYTNWYESDGYRFGFNGQHKENEVAGVGNHNTALFWEYDTRLGRRWNLDPVPQIGISDYAVNYNNPIMFNDPLGNSANDPKSHTVKKGETLSGISKKTGVSVADLAKMNKIEDVNKIRKGQVLKVNPEVDFTDNPYGGYSNPNKADGTETHRGSVLAVGIDYAGGSGSENEIITGGDALKTIQNWDKVQNLVSQGMGQLSADGKMEAGERFVGSYSPGKITSYMKKVIQGKEDLVSPVHVIGSFNLSMRVNADGKTMTITLFDSKSVKSLSDNYAGRDANKVNKSQHGRDMFSTQYIRFMWDVPVKQ